MSWENYFDSKREFTLQNQLEELGHQTTLFY